VKLEVTFLVLFTICASIGAATCVSENYARVEKECHQLGGHIKQLNDGYLCVSKDGRILE
jgi:hypothetical protein